MHSSDLKVKRDTERVYQNSFKLNESIDRIRVWSCLVYFLLNNSYYTVVTYVTTITSGVTYVSQVHYIKTISAWCL